MHKYLKTLVITTLFALIGLGGVAYGQSVLFGIDGGTGIGSADPSDVGDCLGVADDSPFLYEFVTCAGGSGGGVATSTNPLMATYLVATSTTQSSILPNASTTNLSVSGYFDFLGTVINNVPTWFNGLFDTQLATKDTDDLTEGSSNLYNQTHTGEVTGATALTIADNIIEEANLEVTNSPTDNYILSYDTGTGGFTWIEDATGSGTPFAWTPVASGVATSTTLILGGGFNSTASSTADQLITNNATSTSYFEFATGSVINFFGNVINSIKDVFHFDKEITVCSDESCDYITDGTADQVQINQALDAIRSAGGTVQLYAGTYDITAAIDMSGATANSIDNPEIKLLGAGRDATILSVDSGINAIEFTDEPKYEVAFMTFEIAGSSDALNQVAGMERGNWQSSVHDIFIKSDFTTHTGWGIDMESPFRMTFSNIEMNGVANGMRLASHVESFNPGNLSVDRLFIDLWNDASNSDAIGIQLSTTATTSTGIFNLTSWNRVDIAGGSNLTSSIGIHLIGATADPGSSYYGEVRQNDFNSLNIEDVQTAFKLEAASDNTFTNINYTRVLDDGIVFDLDDESFNNKFENTYLDSNTASITVNVINDQANDTSQPNVFDRIVGFSAGTATLNATTSDSTIIRNIDLAEGSPTIDSDLTAKMFFLGNLDTSNATVKRFDDFGFTFPSTATTTTASTTVSLGSSIFGERWDFSVCRVTSGTGGYQYTDGSNNMEYRAASTTESRFALSTNNSFSVDERRQVVVGPLTNALLTCSLYRLINP